MSAIDSSNVYLTNAYKETVKFDLKTPGKDSKNLKENRISKTLSRSWDLDVRQLMSSERWLSIYGLVKNKTSWQHILPLLGKSLPKGDTDPLKDDSDTSFNTALRIMDSSSIKITCTRQRIEQVISRLNQAIDLYQRRLDWLTTESRRTFGVIQEKIITIVIDVKTTQSVLYNNYISTLEGVLREQIPHLAKFNLIRASVNLRAYQPHCIPVSQESISDAIAWLWSLDRMEETSATGCVEAVLKAHDDSANEAVYLYTEGDSVESCREMLKDKLKNTTMPTNIVSLNCTDMETVSYLKNLSMLLSGRCHLYVMKLEMQNPDLAPETSPDDQVLRRETVGGEPEGAGPRIDVTLLFRELDRARSLLMRLTDLSRRMPKTTGTGQFSVPQERPEQYMSSSEWLEHHGLVARRLTLFDVLQSVATEPCDEAANHPSTDLPAHPGNIPNPANFCDSSAHIQWKDGRILHVHVTPDLHTSYENRMKIFLDSIENRLTWLFRSSRALFGTIREDNIYILLDVSSSMHPSFRFILDNLFMLMQEQLRHKKRFNLIAFGTRVTTWKNSLTEVSEDSLRSAWQWAQGLRCTGSTNTLDALRTAIADSNTQAIYLLTDGKPDQDPKLILPQVLIRPRIPVNTISFNCADRVVNTFLRQLSSDSGGRFHFYDHGNVCSLASETGPTEWESDDIRALRKEYETGIQSLRTVHQLRDQCQVLTWKSESQKQLHSIENQTPFALQSKVAVKTIPFSRVPRPPMSGSPSKSTRGSTISDQCISGPGTHRSRSAITSSLVKTRRGNIAVHTRTSLMRTQTKENQFELMTKGTAELTTTQQEGKLTRSQSFPRSGRRKKIRSEALKAEQEEGTSVGADGTTITVPQYLSRRGLRARRLTIIDALTPSKTRSNTHHNLLLNNRALNRVFGELLPAAHKSCGSLQNMELVNPGAIDLELYQQRVQDSITEYTRFLDNLIWRVLSEEEKSKFEAPISFSDNKLEILQALDRQGWPISEADINRLQMEVELGLKYIQQAEDLMSEETNEEQIEDVVASVKASSEEIIIKKKAGRPLDTFRGQTVVARNKVDGLYYPGFVIQCPTKRLAIVQMSGLGKQEIPTRFLVPIRGAIPCPSLRVGDYVLSRVRNEKSTLECYVPGIVQIPGGRSKDSFCTVIIYTGEKSTTLRGNIVKIDKDRYNFTVRFIRSLEENGIGSRFRPILSESNTDVADEDAQREARSKISETQSKSPRVKRGLSKQTPVVEDEQAVEGVPEQSQETPEQDRLSSLQKRIDEKLRRQEERQKRHKEETRMASRMQQDILLATMGAQAEAHRNLTEKQRRLKGDINQLNFQEQMLDTLPSLDSYRERPEFAQELCQKLPALNVGEEVLTRWPEDGWYFRGLVRQSCGDFSYFIEDSCGDLERIWREDIIAETDDVDTDLKDGDAVVALHPSYSFSYAPAVLLSVVDPGSVRVRLYDGVEADLPRDEVYAIPAEKFELDVQYIVRCEEQWVGQAVVARNDSKALWALGVVKERIGNSRLYAIEWADETISVQTSVHIFGALSKRHKINAGDRVLAIEDTTNYLYLPGIVQRTDGDTLSVKFCSGRALENVNEAHCFWLSQDYYDSAITFYRSKR